MGHTAEKESFGIQDLRAQEECRSVGSNEHGFLGQNLGAFGPPEAAPNPTSSVGVVLLFEAAQKLCVLGLYWFCL